jgi:hypothetical protein
MHHYQVSEVTAKGQAFALRDGADRYHAARATSAVPHVGLDLYGHPPSLGFHILVGVANGQVYRLIFERVDCGRQVALDHCAPEAGHSD